jgi:hypothetical protein
MKAQNYFPSIWKVFSTRWHDSFNLSWVVFLNVEAALSELLNLFGLDWVIG